MDNLSIKERKYNEIENIKFNTGIKLDMINLRDLSIFLVLNLL